MRQARVTTLLILIGAGLSGCGQSSPQTGTINARTLLAHNVYFTLHDNTAARQEALVRECVLYLKDHPGVVFFAAGTLAQEYDRPVNDTDFQVSLHVVFDGVASHDRYQIAPDHLTFIERNKDNWKSVRVFDSWVAQ